MLRLQSIRAWSISRNEFRWSLLLVFILAFGIRWIYLEGAVRGLLGSPDTFAYEGLAESIHERTYQTDKQAGPGGFPADLQRPPGYPFFLFLVNPRMPVDRVRTAELQSLIGACFAVGLALLVAGLLGHGAGLLAGLLYAIDWATILHTPLVLTDMLAGILCGLAALLYGYYLKTSKSVFSALAGAALGLSALVRPSNEFLFFAFLLAWLVQPRRRKLGLVFVLTFTATVAPWMIRNYHRHGVMALSAIDTAALYFYVGQSAAQDISMSDASGGTELNAMVLQMDAEWQQKVMLVAERRREMNKEAWMLIRQYWRKAAILSAAGTIRLAFGAGRGTLAASVPGISGKQTLLLSAYGAAEVLALWCLALLGLFAGFRKASAQRSIIVLLASSVFFILLPSCNILGYIRYRVPAAPVLCALAGSCALSLYRRQT
jgi:hypothetical protein